MDKMTCTFRSCKGIVIEESDMKKALMKKQQMVLAALENQKRISATIDVTDAFVLLCESNIYLSYHYVGIIACLLHDWKTRNSALHCIKLYLV